MTSEAAKKLSEDWLDRLLAGDHQAFAEFVEKYKQTVFLCCRTLDLRSDEAEDVASETFLAAYRGLSRYRGQAKLSTWLWRIAYRQGVNYLRKNQRQKRLLAESDEQPVNRQEDGPASAVQREEKERLVWEAVKQLPRLWAVVIVLFYREEKSVKDIAKTMQMRQNTVRTYLFRGRKRLKEILATAFGEDTDVGG